MMTRITRRVVALCLLFLAAGAGLNSCNPELVSPPVGTADFSSIRVMNFAACDEPNDVFIYQQGSLDTVIIRAVAYGVGSAYATNLTPGTYTVQVTKPNQRDIKVAEALVSVSNRVQKTLILWSESPADADPTAWTLQEVALDRPNPTPEANKVYVRFLNAKQMNVNVVLDNPMNNPLFTNVGARGLTDYVALNHALDTSYAIYLTDPANSTSIISRLGGAAFAPGSFYTIVFGGNDLKCRDTTAEKADTLRIRYFDDNEAGNELTFPVQQSLRFNVINGLISPPNATDSQRQYTEIGLVVNNDDRFLVDRMIAKQVAPILTGPGVETTPDVIPTGFFTLPWTDAILVSMYRRDGLTGSTRGNPAITKYVDARLGNRRNIKSDEPFSMIIMDTVNNNKKAGFPWIDSSGVRTFGIPLPVTSPSNEITLVLVNALARFKIQPATAGTQAKFYVNGEVPSFWNTPQPQEKYSTMTIPATELQNINIKVEIGRTSVVQTLEKNFQALPGGVYEVVIVGQRENTTTGTPEILVLHTNPRRVSQ
jgi:hypothetical protein